MLWEGGGRNLGTGGGLGPIVVSGTRELRLSCGEGERGGRLCDGGRSEWKGRERERKRNNRTHRPLSQIYI